VLRDHLRRHRRTPDELDLDKMSIVDLGASPTSLLAARSEERLLLHGLRKIPVASQVILELYYWEHMTGPELGVLLAVPEDTARSRLRRAKQQLEAAIRELEASASDLHSTISGLDQWAAGLRAQLAQAR